jgi:hypothetical protein
MGTFALAGLALLLLFVDVVWLIDGHLLRFYARSSYAREMLEQLNGGEMDLSAHAQVLVSDKPGWVAPLAIGGFIAYAGGLVAVPWLGRRWLASSRATSRARDDRDV